MLREFKPALFFLLRFVGIYFAANIVYGLYIESYHHHPDPVTYLVTSQTSLLLNLGRAETSAVVNTQGPTVFLETSQEIVLSVFEGCNGINVMIVFVAFMAAFGGPPRKMLWFIPAGILAIHIFNLLRIGLLFHTAQHYEHLFYYFHKYIFTASLYLVVFALWAVWVKKFVQKLGRDANVQPS